MSEELALTSIDPVPTDFGNTGATVIVNEKTGELFTRNLSNQVKRIGADSQFTPSGTGGVQQTVDQAINNGLVSVLYFIPVSEHAAIKACTSTTDVATYIQTAIDAINSASPTGGVLYFPPGKYLQSGIVLKSGVVLMGTPTSFSGNPSHGVRLVNTGSGIAVDTPNGTECRRAGIVGMAIVGPASSSLTGNGVRFRDANRCYLKNVMIDGFGDEGLLVDSDSIACVFTDVFVQRSLLDTSRAAKAGAIDVSGSDHLFYNCEATTSQSALSDSNLYLCAWAIRATACFFTDCIGEISDVGFHLTSASAIGRFKGCRADLNWGRGFEVTGGQNQFDCCTAYRNSQETDNTYSGFYFAATTGGSNVLAGCMSSGRSADSKKPKYGYEDAMASATVASRNQYVGCSGVSNGTALYSVTSSVLGPAPLLPNVGNRPADADATPSVANSTFLDLNNYATTTSITAFDDAVGTQFLMVKGKSTVTIANGTNIKTNTGAAKTLRDNVFYFFVHVGSNVWWELTADEFLSGSATYDPASLADGAGATTTVTVTGAALGDFAEASFSLDLQGITLTAWVSASNTVSVRFQNESGGPLDLGSGTLKARVRKA